MKNNSEFRGEIKGMEKIKTTFAEIVVHGTNDRPYYEIMYYDMERDVLCIGYSSYYLDIVFKYLENYFEIVKDVR